MFGAPIDLGVICGRFQPFHLGHAEYLASAKAKCRKLVVGITNPDPGSWVESSEAPHRHLEDSNPFTYFERMAMIRAALPDLGILDSDVAYVPFPLLAPHLLQYYVPKTACIFVTIYASWGATRFDLLRREGFTVEVLWQRVGADRIITGSLVRSAIRKKDLWHHFVPRSTVSVIESIISGRKL